MRFNGQTKNYVLYNDGGQHYVGEKRFDSIRELVADGLICMFLELHAGDYIMRMHQEAKYEESPYSQYQRMTQRQKSRRPATTADATVVDSASSSSLLGNTNATAVVDGKATTAAAAASILSRPRNSSRSSMRSSSDSVDAIQQKAHRQDLHIR